jgi:hypothetical protein
MSKSYRCDICDYNVNTSSNYNKHLLTKKHINKVNGVLSINNCIIIDDNDTSMFTCYYCKQKFKNNNGNKYKHIHRCKEKHQLAEQKLAEQKLAEQKLAEQKLAEQKLAEQQVTEQKQLAISDEHVIAILKGLLAEMIPKSDQPNIQIINNNNITNNNITNNTNNTNNSSNDNNCINFNYIKKHYKNPKTIQECLAPPLTEIEKYNITKATPIVGCEYIIKARCITNVDLEERPFHSIDESRDKFAVFSENENNTKNWITQNGSDITKSFMPIIRGEYEKQYNNPLCDHAKIAEGISYMYMDGNKKIVKSIAKMTNLKNNLANSMKSKSEDDKSDDDKPEDDKPEDNKPDDNKPDDDNSDEEFEKLKSKYTIIDID